MGAHGPNQDKSFGGAWSGRRGKTPAALERLPQRPPTPLPRSHAPEPTWLRLPANRPTSRVNIAVAGRRASNPPPGPLTSWLQRIRSSCYTLKGEVARPFHHCCSAPVTTRRKDVVHRQTHTPFPLPSFSLPEQKSRVTFFELDCLEACLTITLSHSPPPSHKKALPLSNLAVEFVSSPTLLRTTRTLFPLSLSLHPRGPSFAYSCIRAGGSSLH